MKRIRIFPAIAFILAIICLFSAACKQPENNTVYWTDFYVYESHLSYIKEGYWYINPDGSGLYLHFKNDTLRWTAILETGAADGEGIHTAVYNLVSLGYNSFTVEERGTEYTVNFTPAEDKSSITITDAGGLKDYSGNVIAEIVYYKKPLDE